MILDSRDNNYDCFLQLTFHNFVNKHDLKYYLIFIISSQLFSSRMIIDGYNIYCQSKQQLRYQLPKEEFPALI